MSRKKPWISVSIRGWLATQTAAVGSPTSAHSPVMWEVEREVIHAWCFSTRMHALTDVRALEKKPYAPYALDSTSRLGGEYTPDLVFKSSGWI